MNLFGKYMSQDSMFEVRFNYESFKLMDMLMNASQKAGLLNVTKSNIIPVNGSNLWEQTPFQKPLPPIARRMTGRPATKRRRHSSEKETKFATARVKVSRTVRCGNCSEFGHNKQSCTSETRPRVPHTPQKIGRPRKNQEEHESATTETPMNQNVDPNQASSSRRKTRRRSTKTSNEPNQPIAQRRKINSRRGEGRAGDKEQNQENGQQEVDEGMVSQVIDEVVEGQSKSRKLSEILDDVENGINEILRDIQEEEPKFLEGNADDVIPEKIQLNEEDVAMLLESEYNIGEIEGGKGISMPLDDMTPVELELQDQEGHPDDVEVFVDDGGVNAGDEEWSEGDDEGVVAADNHVVDEVQLEAGIKADVEGVDDCHTPKPEWRKRSGVEDVMRSITTIV
ncbi:unnamed protein product [Lactuca virosa]|uniref:CCHC-type domain-containing protein n=1 Tax=Lactuca virosa TaxID=75947 RepID=A0AAU9NWD3_9ASTR|nr:unnamed protein product [Lactuca virosa]